MRDAQPRSIRLADYRPPMFLIPRTALHFELYEDFTLVHATLGLVRNPASDERGPLRLAGEGLELRELLIDGEAPVASRWRCDAEGLELDDPPEAFELCTTVRIDPRANTALEGLYLSRGMFCTQCEAEGFRRISYFLDRPDVMSVYSVTIDADRRRYPVLLSNGNRTSQRALDDGRHRVVWEDPFPKPSYLFALVAGDLACIEDRFRTRGGRDVALRIYVEEKDLAKGDHAMASLKHAMRWDEERYGREYDLDVFNIVAVDDFNMGAMENKGLNIFNTSCVLACPATTTDAGFQRVEAIVAHEYFHNWSGNRVTCRDWFQLSLKEGFTVFRDAEFSADLGSRDLKRIEDATLLRTAQFAEDAGPLAHPVRPDSYIEINNFYTLTVYEKGAEVVRMLHTLLGEEGFRAGSDLYFERHDGQAVTCDDFIAAMADANDTDLGTFKRWYGQAGTPELTVEDAWDKDSGAYTLTVRQQTPATPGQPGKAPLVIPLALGLLGDAGNLRLTLEGETPDGEQADNTHRVLVLEEPEQSFTFTGLPERPVPALLRGFSAPVRLSYPYRREQLRTLMTRDDDGFVRWDAGQQLMVAALGDVQAARAAGTTPALDPLLAEACAALLDPATPDPAVAAAMLALPGESTLVELAAHAGGADIDAIHDAREWLRAALGEALEDVLVRCVRRHPPAAAYAPVGEQIGPRSLRNTCLGYLATRGDTGLVLARAQLAEADNLTDRLAALRVLAQAGDATERETALEGFYAAWQHEALVVNHWLQLQATLDLPDAVERVTALMEHPAFDLGNPNKVRSLVGAFAGANLVHFHRADGAGYGLLGGVVEALNARNPQIAARLLTPLTKWRTVPVRVEAMRAELSRLAALPALSPDVYEVVSKSLESQEPQPVG
ncbi:aminopeptidase N [Pseudohaliea rubra]|uniref:Aminopeptidase N n=1 Tax=Pseudohaliea rubra DSM 19751 TaxID=1265313 RepID=A0A095XZG8_9GAMM|nr:aminopeptidase N [Pseudohaliea rubra]KGE05151.1 Membrane alanine aminopeptidase N [Pseudohaliea rubra DSM 19751]